METSPTPSLPSPNSHSSSSSNSSTTAAANNNNGFHQIHHHQQPPPPPLPSPKPITRSESSNPYPTTFVQADTSSFKQVVQMLTGSPRPASADPTPKSHSHNIPPIKSIPKKSQSSSGFKLYERRNSLKNLKINPLNPIFAPPASSGFSPRRPEILSPSILDFPSLVLSPVTPLIPDPFDRSANKHSSCYSPMSSNNSSNGGQNSNLSDADVEEKAIKEKGFYLHPSPATTPREVEPRLLPLFPVTSPRVSGSANPST